MPDRLYDNGRNLFARGELHWRAQAGSIVCAFLVDATYIPDTAKHEYLSDIPIEARHGNGGSGERIDAPTLTLFDPKAGVCDAEDVTFSRIPTGTARLDYLVLFADAGSDDSSPLIAVIESARGLPFTPHNADVEIVWSNAQNRIFKL